MGWSNEVAGFADSTMPISQKEYPTKVGKLDHAMLRYYPDNPRIYTAIRQTGDSPDQDSIQEYLQSLPHVQKLKKEIVDQGGNQEEIIVRDKSFEVLEGNSRLAAFRDLKGLGYQQIRCTVLPENISDDHIFVLLGQIHINGKTPWAKHEQARYLQRMEQQGRDLSVLAQNIGLSAREGRKYVRTIELMEKYKDGKNEHFSYWHAFLSNRKAQEVLAEHPVLEKLVASEIKDQSFQKATDFRDALTPVCSDRTAVRSLLNGKRDLQEAYAHVVHKGATTPVVKKVGNAKTAIAEIDREELLTITTPQLNKVEQDLKRIQQKSAALLKIVDSIKHEEISN